MNDSQKILPITASADGRMNMYFSQCLVVGQVMNYAACLWRQSVLANPTTKVPADWNACSEAAKCGRCNATEMRREEVLQGRAIYFRGRATGQTVGQEAMAIYKAEHGHSVQSIAPPSTGAVFLGGSRSQPAAPPVIPAAPVKRTSSMLDVMGGEPDYAAAINAAVITPVVTKPVPQIVTLAHVGPPAVAVAAPHIGQPAVVKPLGVAPVALPGESPLAMARRLAAQRQSATT